MLRVGIRLRGMPSEIITMQAKGILSFGNILLYGQKGNKILAGLPDDGLKKIHGVVVRAFSVFDLKAYARAGMLLPTGNWIVLIENRKALQV